MNLGFFACGIAKAGTVDEDECARYRKWIDSGNHASMDYLAGNMEKRFNPCLLMDGVKSIVCVALNYAPATTLQQDSYGMAAYALGQDYHTVVKERLDRLASRLGLDVFRAFCDTAPILERYWAVKAGIGWIGKNQQLIIPKAGSMFFLGELFIQEEVEPDRPMTGHCGNCTACVDACPTGALFRERHPDAETPGTGFNANLCLSYQTIENRGDIPEALATSMEDCIYGCDRCQQACPWNRFSTPNTTPELQPKPELIGMTKSKWQNLTEDEYRCLFKGSAVKRAKYSGLMRNIMIATENDRKKPNDKDNTR